MLDLTESNPTRAGIVYESDVILEALRNRESLGYEPAALGLRKAREAVAGYYGNLQPDQVLLTASTSEAYSFLFKLLCDPGDEVLVPRPSYPLFDFLARLECVEPRQYSLRYHEGWWIDPESVERQITDRTRAIVVVNPNNPTGSYLKRHDLECLERWGITLISDEVFSDYGFEEDPDRVPLVAARARVPAFSLNGFSKLLGLPQMKLGWIVGNDAESMRKLEFVADTYLSVSGPVQHAAAAWLGLRERFHGQMMARLRANLVALRRMLEPLRVEGGWCAIVPLPRTLSEEEWVLRLLEEEGVLVQPGYFYDFESEAFAVVSLLAEPSVFEEGLARMKRRMDEQG